MRRFKLLKDLPGIEAGTVLVTDGGNDDDGCGLLLIDCDDALKPETGFCLFRDDFFGPHKGGRRTPIGNWMEELPEEHKRWRADKGGLYYYIGYGGMAYQDLDVYGPSNNGIYKIGNYFATEEKARAYADYLKALAIVRDDANGFEPNWEDRREKWYVGVWRDKDSNHEVGVDKAFSYQSNGVFGLPYFKTRDDAKASIKKHKAEWLTIFGVKDETESDDE